MKTSCNQKNISYMRDNYHNFFFSGDRVINPEPDSLLSNIDSINNMIWTWPSMDLALMKQNPLIEPIESLNELYVKRARELREHYSYIKLLYSGGPDSHNVLETFMLNDIFLDEICIFDYNEFTNRSLDSNVIRESTTERFEIDIVAIPLAKKMIERYSPKTKLTFEYMIPKLDAHVKSVDIHSDRLLQKHFRDILFHGTNVVTFDVPAGGVILYGSEKPYVKKSKQGYFIHFFNKYMRRLNENKVELFYTHPSCARMIIKQSHKIVAVIPELIPNAEDRGPGTRSYENALAKILYDRKHSIPYGDTWKESDMIKTPLYKAFHDQFDIPKGSINYNMMYYIMNNDHAKSVLNKVISVTKEYSNKDLAQRILFGSFPSRNIYIKYV